MSHHAGPGKEAFLGDRYAYYIHYSEGFMVIYITNTLNYECYLYLSNIIKAWISFDQVTSLIRIFVKDA
jgi:hypothetical protein